MEAKNLAGAHPELLAELKAEYARFSKEVNLIEVPDDYNPITQVQKNAARNPGEAVTAPVPALD